MIANKKRALVITTFIIIAAIAVVICVGYFTQETRKEFDGILVFYQNGGLI